MYYHFVHGNRDVNNENLVLYNIWINYLQDLWSINISCWLYGYSNIFQIRAGECGKQT